MMMRYALIGLLFCSLSAISACGLLKSDKAEYRKSQTDIALEVPEDLKEPESDDALLIP